MPQMHSAAWTYETKEFPGPTPNHFFQSEETGQLHQSPDTEFLLQKTWNGPVQQVAVYLLRNPILCV